MLSRKMRPIRLSRRSEPFDSDQFIYELKIDGFRALAHIDGGQAQLISRNGNTFRGFAISPRGSLYIFASKAPAGEVPYVSTVCFCDKDGSAYRTQIISRLLSALRSSSSLRRAPSWVRRS